MRVDAIWGACDGGYRAIARRHVSGRLAGCCFAAGPASLPGAAVERTVLKMDATCTPVAWASAGAPPRRGRW
jgi:hypothetical protein